MHYLEAASLFRYAVAIMESYVGPLRLVKAISQNTLNAITMQHVGILDVNVQHTIGIVELCNLMCMLHGEERPSVIQSDPKLPERW